VPVVTKTGVVLDAGEVLLSLRSRDVWDAVQLDREVDEAGRVSLLRRVLCRLTRDGVALTRAAHDLDTQKGTRPSTRRDTPATVIRFLRFRDSLWPASTDATHGTARASARDAAHETDTIPSRDPAVPAFQRDPLLDEADAGVAREQNPRISEVRAVLEMAAAAFAEIVGRPYQHARAQALRADRRAVTELLAVPGVDLEAIESVWRRALVQREWPRIETLADLSQHWTRLAARMPALRTVAQAETEVVPDAAASSCPLWPTLVRNLQQRLRPDLFERWFSSLTATVEGKDLVLHANDDFHRAFLEENYRSFLAELLEVTSREQEGSNPALGLRITSSALSNAGGAEA
jgi:hypothetical protein